MNHQCSATPTITPMWNTSWVPIQSLTIMRRRSKVSSRALAVIGMPAYQIGRTVRKPISRPSLNTDTSPSQPKPR